MNEEMYEEEDDDLPMQFRRINALNPGFAYSAFNERVNSYLQGQIGVRNYLHQAIYQANQTYQANQAFNANQLFGTTPMMPQNPQQQQQQQQQFQNNMQAAQHASHDRSASIGTPQGFASQRQAHINTKASAEARRGSTASSPLPTGKRPRSAQSSQPPTPHALQHSSPAPPLPSPSADNPLSFKLDPNMQQLVDGQQGAFGLQPYQMTSGLPMPSTYSYHPNSKQDKRDSGTGLPNGHGLDQTLTPNNMHNTYSTPLYQDPQSSLAAPGAMDYSNGGFDMLNGDYSMFNDNSDSKYAFNVDFGSGAATGNANDSGQVTPAAVENQWNPDDFFTFGPEAAA